MLRKVLILTAVVSVFSACFCTEAAQIPVSWDGGGDGHSWSDPNNWDPNSVPDNDMNTFTVTIDAGAGEVEVGLQQSRTIDQLVCLGNIELQSWTWYLVNLTLINGLINYGNLAIELDIAGDVTNTDGATLEMGEHLNIYGNLYNAPQAKIEVFPRDIDIEGGVVENDGLIRAISGGSIGEALQFTNNGEIQLLLDGGSNGDVFDNNSTGSIEGSGGISSSQLLRNKGTIYASGGPLLLYSDGPIENTGTLGNRVGGTVKVMASVPYVNNQGAIEVNGDGSVVFDCNLVNEADANIYMSGGTLSASNITQSADATFEGQGDIATANLVIESEGLIRLTGPANIFGNVQIDPNATLEISDGQTLITGHTICDGTIHLIGGTVVFQDGCDCEDCNIINEAGLDRNHFDINADGIENFKDFAAFAESWLWQATWY